MPSALLGRCFAIQRVVSEGFLPLGFCVAGPLADRVFEPAMAPGGRLAPFLGGWIGTGAGRGIAVIFLLGGLAFMVAGAAGYLVPRLRRVEKRAGGRLAGASSSCLKEPDAALAVSRASFRTATEKTMSSSFPPSNYFRLALALLGLLAAGAGPRRQPRKRRRSPRRCASSGWPRRPSSRTSPAPPCPKAA